jgi:hypothetical protein
MGNQKDSIERNHSVARLTSSGQPNDVTKLVVSVFALATQRYGNHLLACDWYIGSDYDFSRESLAMN